MKLLPPKLSETVRSSSFLEKALLLGATAALTGFLVPEITARMADRRLKQQTVFQAGIARQDKIIDAQAAFYDRFADLVWEFHLLHVDVSFRRFLNDQEKYQQAVDRYATRSAELLGRLRAEISKGKRLMENEGHQALLRLFENELLPKDAALEKLIGQGGEATAESWRAHHQGMMGPVRASIDQTLDILATQMKLRAEG